MVLKGGFQAGQELFIAAGGCESAEIGGLAALVSLHIEVFGPLGGEERGEEREVGESDFDHGEEHYLFCFGELPDPVVGGDDAEDVPERVGLVDVVARAEDDELDDAMRVDHVAKVDDSTDEQPLLLVAADQDVGEADVVVDHLLGDRRQDGLDIVELSPQARNHRLQCLVEIGKVLVAVLVETSNVDEVLCALLLDLLAEALDAGSAEEK